MIVANDEYSLSRQLANINFCHHHKISGHGSSFPSSCHWTRKYVKFTVVGSSCHYLPQIDVVIKPRPYVCLEHSAVSVTAETMETACWVHSRKLKYLWLSCCYTKRWSNVPRTSSLNASRNAVMWCSNTFMAGALIYLSFILLYLIALVSCLVM